MNDQLLHQTKKDLIEDFEELLYLFVVANDQFRQFRKNTARVKKFLPSSVKEVEDQLLLWEKKNNEYVSALKTILKEFQADKNLLEKGITKKEFFAHTLRMQYGILASLITVFDWQSPSYMHALKSLAGKETGAIVATFNDYKRDLHRDGLLYENAFTKEYIAKFLFAKKALLTSSGMSAFTTIITYLQMEHAIRKPIVIGKSIYFENKEIIKKLFPNDIIEVDESDTKSIIALVAKKQPSVIILDSLSNTIDVVVPNLPTLIEEINHVAKHNITMIVDNTCLGVSIPMLQLFDKKKNITPIIFESMNKYHQFGMDRVTGGIIYTKTQLRQLFLAREHLGTNIPDASVYALPWPNKKMLVRRLTRFNRNTKILAAHLAGLNKYNHIIESIVHPSMSTHPCFNWTEKMVFTGCFFVIKFRKQYRKVATYQRFAEHVITEAKRKNINITAGTSFGLNGTRVYVTALSDEYGVPFFRVALGTETMMELEILKEVFTHALEKISKRRIFA